MTPQRHQQVGDLFHRALDLDEASRVDFLRRACADDEELRLEVESLLAAHHRAGAFIATPAIEHSPSPAMQVLAEPAQAGPPPRTVGPYQIVGLLGRGGMGEVYRGHDSRLGRDVAIKMLPDEFARDAGRRSRFEREARMLAALNHPHIAALFGIEDVGSHHALVMELIEGDTLADRIAAGRVPVAEALSIASQIAEALEAAHEQGIVHRDLKPANITVRHDGTVKVLDFGLAKALDSRGSDAREDAPLTASRAIVGTAMYMSPEQTRGGAVDRGTDIWAFGCVLYEMLTGHRAFDGKSEPDVIAAVLERSPDWNALPPATPLAVRRVLRRCLQKDARDRWRDIADVRLELRDPSDLDSDHLGRMGKPARSVRPRLLAATALVGALVAAAVGGWLGGIRSVSKPLITPARLSIARLEPPPVGSVFGASHLALSSDASRVAYTSRSLLLIRRMDQKETVTVDVLAQDPFFSPDGEWVAFFDYAATPALEKVPVHGGLPVAITQIAGRPYGGAWRADGTIVFSTTEGLYQVSANGGTPSLLLKPDPARKQRAFVSPAFMPDGRSLLFTIVPAGSIDGAQIGLLNVDTRDYTVVLTGGSAARYVPTGHLVYVSGQTLNAVAFDRDARRIRGEPVPLPDVRIATAADNGVAEFDVSSTGTLVFIAPTLPRPNSVPVWVSRSGKRELLPLEAAPYYYARVSPSGQLMALDILGANRDIWIWNVQRPSLTRLTRGAGEEGLPTWSPNGRLFFESQQNGNFDIYSQAPDGSTPARLEFSGPGDQMALGFTPDGAKLIVNENFKDISVITLTKPPRLEPLLHSDANEWDAEVSPDGKWIAYESDESGDGMEVFVRPFPNVDARRERVSTGGGRFPMWARNGSELFFLDPHGAMMAVSITLSPTLVLGHTTKLFDTAAPGRQISGRQYDIGPDGRFLMLQSSAAPTAETVDVTVVLNWAEDLKRLLPP